jgi:hypothetical protein
MVWKYKSKKNNYIHTGGGLVEFISGTEHALTDLFNELCGVT